MDSYEVNDRYAEQLSWPTDRLLQWAAQRVSVPKIGAADSFVLHAPLELMARATLLPLVRPSHRNLARQRLVWLTDAYVEAGPGIAPPAGVVPSSIAGAAAALLTAIDSEDLDEIDRYAA